MEFGDGVLSFVAQKKIAGAVAVHKSVFTQTSRTGRVVEDVEGRFLVRIAVRVIEAHPMPEQVVKSSPAQMIGQHVSGGLPRRCVAAPAFGLNLNCSPSAVARLRRAFCI